MATSPIYSWPEPDNTDLVKNGALAIRTLGNAIDTTMGTMVAKTIIDAKGDLIAGTAADTASRLAVGNNGETLVADSSTSTGLRYQEPKASQPLLNSAFQVWQRGTSGTGNANTATTNYLADRWLNYRGAAGSTYSRQVTGDTTNLPNIQYCMRVSRDSANTSTSTMYLDQIMETVNSIPFAGKAVTLSFYARKGANYSATSSLLSAYLTSGTGTDQNINGTWTGAVNVVSGSATLTTTWQRFQYTGTIGATATQLDVEFQFVPTGTAGAADYYEVTGVQLEVGSVATPFKTYAATIQGELAACQRYYVRFDGASYAVSGYGTFTSATNAVIMTPLPTTMRVTPTAVDYSSVSVFEYSAAFTPSAITIDTSYANPKVVSVNATVSGATAGRTGFFRTSGSTAYYIGYTAEL